MIHQRIGRGYVIPLDEEAEIKRLTKLANDLGIKYLNNNNMLIKVTSPEACEKIATLLRPSLRSVPVSINIFKDETFMNWKNKQVTCVKVSIIGINICAQSLEIVFMGAHGVPFGPIVIPIEYA